VHVPVPVPWSSGLGHFESRQELQLQRRVPFRNIEFELEDKLADNLERNLSLCSRGKHANREETCTTRNGHPICGELGAILDGYDRIRLIDEWPLAIVTPYFP
jgi:hypothetical protein